LATYALIPAAGSGSRIAAAQPKQYAPIAGRPMLWHAVRAVCVPPVEFVFVVLAPGDSAYAQHDWSAFAGKVEPLYCGGETRRDSVHNGLVAARDTIDADDWVLVHDAARPCLSRSDLRRLLQECEGDQVGAILALPLADTAKRVSKDEAGVQRRLAQTPQMFRAGVLLQALQRATGMVTDEACAIEQMGLRPRLVAGSRENLKVTWPEDLAIAEGILQRRA
jgi:2-C-methyl-D-erythritol 4-phosphate cytidylyltransferase